MMARDAGQGASGLFRLGQGAIVGGGIGLALCLIVLRGLRDRDGPPADGS
ncbi:MAG: hypothetical protein OER90_15175 [Gemmatimonadota bacterium]|nr:hypothetical protein [Gemmatimonadota bacterium]